MFFKTGLKTGLKPDKKPGSNLIGLPTLLVHIFVDIGPFFTKTVSNKSPEMGLSIGTGFVKNGPILTKL